MIDISRVPKLGTPEQNVLRHFFKFVWLNSYDKICVDRRYYLKKPWHGRTCTRRKVSAPWYLLTQLSTLEMNLWDHSLLFLQCIIFGASVSDEFVSCRFKHQAVNPRSLFVTFIFIKCFEPFTLIDFKISVLVEYAKYLHFHPTKKQMQ